MLYVIFKHFKRVVFQDVLTNYSAELTRLAHILQLLRDEGNGMSYLTFQGLISEAEKCQDYLRAHQMNLLCCIRDLEFVEETEN